MADAAAADSASRWVRRHAPLIPAGPVLDLACGGGRHARHLAALGHPVLALDRDPAALKRAAGPGIVTLQIDLEEPGARWPFLPGRLAGVVVANYLHRALFGDIAASLAPDGVLIYETFAAGNERFGKPPNPAFLRTPGEWLQVAARHGLTVLAYEAGRVDAPRPAMLQRLCAAGPAFARLDAPLPPC